MNSELLVTLLTPLLLRVTNIGEPDPPAVADTGRYIGLYGRWADGGHYVEPGIYRFLVEALVSEERMTVHGLPGGPQTSDNGHGIEPLVIELNTAAIASIQVLG